MGFGRDVRSDLFHQVTDFSAREVGSFGAPSLITRITNDVQQMQMLVVMLCTLFVSAPIMVVGGLVMAIREDGPMSLILVVAVPVGTVVPEAGVTVEKEIAGDLPLIRGDGTMIWAYGDAAVVRDASGTPLYMLGFGREGDEGAA